MDNKKKCKDCEKDFELTDEELAYYKKMGYPERKRCKPCIAKKRAQEHIDGKA